MNARLPDGRPIAGFAIGAEVAQALGLPRHTTRIEIVIPVEERRYPA